ncbi:hypothetical protein STH12_02450 [Shewanella khirikhana]|uniref:Peptidase M60 domain-containing protein n=1 Tax=Shewanella khirikhana TaxID=1965282 RepID=A0ABN5TXM0_9GAMM|nr:ImpA family metalloprotease [Shewanella khirikhana]AZQ11528.1 hypothetical protein STH12_02450 [Shewanella khirikhana]
MKSILFFIVLILALGGCGEEKTHYGDSNLLPYYTALAQSSSGGSITPASLSIESGEQGRFSVAADNGYVLDSIEGCGGSLHGATFTTAAMSADCRVTASFVPSVTLYTALAQSSSGGSITPASLSIESGEQGRFSVAADNGYILGSIEGCGGSLHGATFTTAAMSADCRVTASFVPSVTLYTALAQSSSGGSITPASLSIESGEQGRFSVAADNGYILGSIEGCGGSLHGATFTTAAMSADCRVTASFVPSVTLYTALAQSSSGGSITPASLSIESGEQGRFSVAADNGYVLDSIEGCGGSLHGATFTTAAMSADCRVTASFVPSVTLYTALAQSSSGGSITPASLSIESGEQGRFSVAADNGYVLDSIEGCGGSLHGATFTTAAMSADCRVTASFVPSVTLYTALAQSSSGGSITPASLSIESGEQGRFSVAADNGYVLDSIEGCGGSLHGATFTTAAMSADCRVTASFVPSVTLYTALAQSSSGGSITPASLSIESGEQGRFSVAADNGYILGSIEGCGGSLHGATFTTAAMSADCRVTASFVPSVTLYTALAQSSSGGSITPASLSIESGEQGRFSVAADNGYILGSIEGCGGSLHGATFTTAAMSADCRVTASFVPSVTLYTALAQSSSGGSITPASLSIESGEQGRFSVAADNGYVLDSIEGCGGSLHGATFTTAAMSADCRVTASFVPSVTLYTALAQSSSGGSITPASLSIESGEQGRFSVAADNGYVLDSIEGCGGSLHGATFTTAAMSADCRVTASFVPSVTLYTALAQSSSGGSITPASLSIESGEQGRFSVAADNGYVLDSIEGCGGSLHGATFTTAAMSADCRVTASFITNAAKAILHHDHRYASDAELIRHARDSIATIEASRKDLVDTLYHGINQISWRPGHDSITFTSFLPERSQILLPANKDGKGNNSSANRGLVMVAEEGEYRSVAMAANLFSVNTSSETNMLLKRLIGWLTKGGDQKIGFSIVTAQVPSRADSRYFPHNEDIRDWLSNNYANQFVINDENVCDYNELLSCIDSLKPDLIILSDLDRAGLGHNGIVAAVAKARAAGIPLLLSNYMRNASAMLSPLYHRMGLVTYGNYWSKLNADAVMVTDIRASNDYLVAVDGLMENLSNGNFSTEHLDACNSNFLACDSSPFRDNFKEGADWLRSSVITLDRNLTDAFSLSDANVIQAGLLLADKYRDAIDYPISWDEHQNWQQAMFADWLINYARLSNQSQPDLGEYITDRSMLTKGSAATYRHPETSVDRKTIRVGYPNQWTTTGWYVLPGQMVTLTRHDNSSAKAEIKLNYHRFNTNRAFQQKVYRAPLELATQRLPLAPNSSVSFSSPYGGPLYLYFSGVEGDLQVDISADGITHHPTIMDFGDDNQIQQFNERLSETELPHVDLRTDGAEQHLRRDRFTNAIGGSVPDVSSLLRSIAEDHINGVYTLAGYKVQGKTLAESMPADVKAACLNMIGNECIDETLHTRKIIQHANYDQNAHCFSGCSGNPWDASWNINPIGWGDNHELGHNLQVNRLNVQYVAASDIDNWTKYSSRAGENSNNIFPYVVRWRTHYLRDGNTSQITSGNMNHKDLFFVFMSDAAAVKNSSGNRVVLDGNCRVLDGSSRYESPWKSNAYAVHNGYRMAFYIQMALRAHKMELVDGTRLANGFNIFTLLYLHQRIFGALSGDIANWDANKDRLGFGMFPYEGHSVYGGRKVRDIPGNDFMLVALSKLTGRNWQSHFDMMGLRYSTLAATQAQANTTKGSLEMGMYVLETDLPPANMSEGLSFKSLSVQDGSTTWHDGSSPVSCPQ